MANQLPNDPNDHLERLIADGKLLVRPCTYHHTPKVVYVDLDALATNIASKMSEIYSNDCRIRSYYSGNANAISTTMHTDITMLADYAVSVCYNRLRTTLEKIYPSARSVLMNPRAPVHNSLEFPAWLSSTLGSIGPILTQDGPVEQYIVYSTLAERAQTFGRAQAHQYLNGPYARIMSALKAVNIRMAPIDTQSIQGSAFPTLCAEPNSDQTWNMIGTIHHSHYENEDIARAIFCLSPLGQSPFGVTGFTAGYVDDATTMTALAAVAAPEGIPTGQTATSAGRAVAHHWDVNYFGIQPAVNATAAAAARTSGCFIIGRGVDRFFAHKRAIDISNTDCVMILRSRLLSTH